jgi:hypothetical protein
MAGDWQHISSSDVPEPPSITMAEAERRGELNPLLCIVNAETGTFLAARTQDGPNERLEILVRIVN